MRKKQLKADLAYANEARKRSHADNIDLRSRNLDLAKELGTLKKIEANRKLAEKIAGILGDGWFAVTEASISSSYQDSPRLSIEFTGDFGTINRVAELMREIR